MSNVGKIVPSWSLGFEKGGFRCEDCYTKYDYQPSGDVVKGMDPPLEFCPICTSLDKAPTPKMAQEEVDVKKEEIKERCDFTHFKFPEPTFQICRICGLGYNGTRTELCENQDCIKWFMMERETDAWKYGPVNSKPSGAIFYQDFSNAAKKFIYRENTEATRQELINKLLDISKKFTKWQNHK